MPYTNRKIARATLAVGGAEVPVLVRLTEVIDIRDRRKALEGQIWLSGMPIAASIGDLCRLMLSNSMVEPIRIVSLIVNHNNQEGVTAEIGFLSDHQWKNRG